MKSSSNNNNTSTSKITPSCSTNHDDDTIDFNARRVPRKQVETWMSHPHIRYALNDPMTSELLTKLSKDPSLYPSYSQIPQIKILITMGILQVPPEYRL